MKSYLTFLKYTDDSRIEDLILVKSGFNLTACIFNIFWFLFNKMFLEGFLFVVYFTILQQILVPDILLLIMIFSCILIGYEAEPLLVRKFKKNHYIFIGVAMGNDEEDAKLKFLQQVSKEHKEKIL